MDNIVTVSKTLFTGVWNMLLHTNFPGTDLSLAAISVAVFIICSVISLFKYLAGMSMGGSTYGRAADAAEKAKRTYDSAHKRKIGF